MKWATAQLAVASFLFVHLLFWIFPTVFQSWNAQIIDQLFVYRTESDIFRPPYDSTVVHVDLSDGTIENLQNFYVSRSHYAQVVRNLGEMGVAAQVWDYIFPKRSSEDPTEDQLLVEATRLANNAYFGLKFNLGEEKPTETGSARPADLQYLNQTSWNVVMEGDPGEMFWASRPTATMAEVAGVSRGLGYLSLRFDQDGVFRRAPLLVRYGDSYYPSFAFRAACDFLGVTPDRIHVDPGNEIILKDAVHPGGQPHDVHIPVDNQCNVVISWVGAWPRMVHYDFGEVLRVSDDRDELEIMGELMHGKIVVVSEVATGSADVGPVPTDNNFPLSGLHANVIYSIVSEQFLHEITGLRMLGIELMVLVVLFFVALKVSSRSLALITVGLLAGYVAIAAALFLGSGVIINILRSVFIIVFGMFSIVAYHYFTEEKNKEALRRSFESYFPPSVVKRIMANPDMITAGGQKKELTIMFSDIKSFTTHSSTLSPDEIQKLLNEYFGAMVEIVFKYQGTVDKFIGDGLMVFFGDPEPQADHALRCVQAGIEMQHKTRELKAKWEAEGKFPLKIRIGINTGPVVVGNMGSERRLSYTVLGSDVNLAQRLESNAPVEGIMISQRTYEFVKDHVPTRQLEPIKVKGLEAPIQVWEVVVEEATKS
jgi:adenylate cyclase